MAAVHIPDRYRIEIRIPCGHDEPCIIDRFHADNRGDSDRQLAAVLAFEPAEMVRRRRHRRPDAPLDTSDLF